MHQHWNFPSPYSGIQMSCEARSQLFDLDACPSTSITQKGRGRPPLIYECIRGGYSIKSLILEQLCMVPRGGGRVLRQRVSRSWPRASPNFWITQMVSFIFHFFFLTPTSDVDAWGRFVLSAYHCLQMTTRPRCRNMCTWKFGQLDIKGLSSLYRSANHTKLATVEWGHNLLHH